ncbi:AMP-binding protein [Desulfobulbus alkaliphilus]|uniref:AMP-binding protein n=1 Tax=Desulfobulbus alkaliphilus TaxID=869814 RepID=UPI001966253A|nr:AMP-binding protein [Desulfobulbus alkaliphilus]MBM9537557.1 AMP-binding protein [Desulfobulbus alkaliphilus]
MEPHTAPNTSENRDEQVSTEAVPPQDPQPAAKSPTSEAETVCQLAAGLAGEIDPDRRNLHVELDSSLERDLGFDSLTKVELLARMEKTLGVSLGEEVLATAETLRDLVRAAGRGSARAEFIQERIPITPPESIQSQTTIADDARTLMDVLHIQASRSPDQVHLLLTGGDNEPTPLTHRQLLDHANSVASGLRERNLQPGANIALMLPTGLEYFFSFFGILLAGAVPVPLYPPVRPSQLEDHLRRHLHILNNCQAQALVTVAEAKPVARLLKAQVATLEQVVTVTELQESDSTIVQTPSLPEDTAFLQYTSGSTGIPKGVILSHANLLTNIRAMGRAISAGPDDVFISWLPLYHDMGLIGAWLGSLYHGCRLVIMPPLSFLARPDRWLWTIHHHRGTLAASPNFGYELCLNRIDARTLAGLDLSSWRLAFNGAEPVSPETVTRFNERFAAYGLRPEAMAPVYGLAENTVGLAFPPLGRKVLIDRIQRQLLMNNGQAIPAGNDDPNPLRFVACGRPLAGHQVRIVDDSNQELPERHVGRLQFRGPSATSGYFRNPRQTAALFHGDWLDTGDLAYLADQDIYLTSRVKDIIIKGGRNLTPYELEEAIGAIEGIRQGCVAVFGTTDKTTATEKLVVLAESRSQDTEKQAALKNQIINLAVDILGLPPDEVILARPGTVLKTSSGKIRRAASRELYEQGMIHRPPRALWLQFIRLTASGVLQQVNRWLQRGIKACYSVYCWLLFAIMAVASAPLVFLLPGSGLRRRAARAVARLLVRLTGTRISVHGLEEVMTEEPLVLVANHQSYVDSVILMAILPERFRFVAKAELAGNPVLRPILNRLGVVFVERFENRKAIEDARRLKELAGAGHSFFFFAEGTFQRMSGLMPFRMGAFFIAAENNMPVVPITIRGTRNILRAESLFLRPGPVHLFIGSPLKAHGSGWNAALALRDETRKQILLHCGEPDLASGGS